ncbi:hypothetical protein D3C71_1195910 [compost metagenome]
MLGDQVVPFAQNGAALLAGHATPGGQSKLRRGNGATRLGSPHVGDTADLLARARIQDIERHAAVGAAPVGANQRLLAKQCGVRQFHGYPINDAKGGVVAQAAGDRSRACARSRIASKSAGRVCRSRRRPAFTTWLGMSWPMSAGRRLDAAMSCDKSTWVS